MGSTGDRLALMQTFVRIVEAGSLSAAAQLLGTTQPTVSRRLQALERSLGVPLLQRSTHGMRLTPDGERCFAQARDLLARWAAFEAELRGARDEPEGLLRVVVPHAFGQARMLQPLADYLQRYPRVQVEWLLHDDRAIDDYVAAGIDCAIQVGEVNDPNLVVIRLSEVRRIVAVAPAVLEGRPVPALPEALAALPWIALHTYYRNEVVLHRAQDGAEYRVPIQPRMSTDSLYALRSAACAGLGVGVGSAWVLAEDLAAGRLVQLVPEWAAAPLPVNLVYPWARHYPARLRSFVALMKEAMPGVVQDVS